MSAFIIILPLPNHDYPRLLTTTHHITRINHFPRTLIISTPYGGSSKYYASSVFESACAPPSRGPQAFYQILSSLYNDVRVKEPSPPSSSSSSSPSKRNSNNAKISFVEFKHLGHTQLLDKSKPTPKAAAKYKEKEGFDFGSICPAYSGDENIVKDESNLLYQDIEYFLDSLVD